MGKKHASQYANFGWLPVLNRKKNLNQEALSAKKVYFEFPITCLLFPTSGQLRQIYL